MTIVTVGATYKDWYPLPGTRYKQYVVDTMREDTWERRTAPRFSVDPHEREGCPLHLDPECEHCKTLTCACPHEGKTSLLDLRESECDTCAELYELALATPAAQAWLAEKAKRPPICPDRDKLSEEIAPDHSLASHPILALLSRETP